MDEFLFTSDSHEIGQKFGLEHLTWSPDSTRIAAASEYQYNVYILKVVQEGTNNFLRPSGNVKHYSDGGAGKNTRSPLWLHWTPDCTHLISVDAEAVSACKWRTESDKLILDGMLRPQGERVWNPQSFLWGYWSFDELTRSQWYNIVLKRFPHAEFDYI